MEQTALTPEMLRQWHPKLADAVDRVVRDGKSEAAILNMMRRYLRKNVSLGTAASDLVEELLTVYVRSKFSAT